MLGFRRLKALFLLVALIYFPSLFAWGGSCCNYNPCDPCSNCGQWGVYVLYENVIVKPYFSRNNAYFLEEPSGVDGQSAVMFDWDYEYSPRIEVGWVNDCGMGLRGRYWNFDNDTHLDASSPEGEIAVFFGEDSINTIGFDGATSAEFRHKLEMNVADFEALFVNCNWTYSAGGRCVQIKQRYTGNELAPAVNGLEARHRFKGGGLTAAIEYFQPIWCGFSFFSKGRGSFLYGDSNFVATNSDNDAFIRSKNDHDVRAVGELQIGIDWRKAFCNMCGFVRFAIETQYWIGGGSAGPGDNAVYDEGNYQNSNPQDSNLGFFGFNVALGLQF